MKPSENAQWLAVEGWCTPEEGDALCAQAKLVGDYIVEIGTGMGKSAIALALGVKDNRVNTFESDRERLAQAEHFARLCGVYFITGYGNSRDFAADWAFPVNLLYIDGWHDAENVRADYHAWAPHVVDGGSIWFHDAYGAGWPDVHALIDELVASEALVLDGYVGTIAKCRKGAA
jgi:predicted O-methyltransferase YrrM